MSAIPSLVDALIVFIFVVPGFVAFRIVQKLGVAKRKLTDYENTIWSFVFSAGILLPFVAITRLTTIDTIRDKFFYPENLAILFGLTGVVGVIIGLILRRLRRNIVEGDPWEIAMKHYAPDGSWVKVITKTGEEYTGKYRFAGIEDNKRELMIANPKQIIRNEDGTIKNEFEIGKELLLTESDVARVFYFEEWGNNDD
jgi:uncharacterized protein DUF6338